MGVQMTELTETQLTMLCTALGWQGGTYHQVLERVRQLSGTDKLLSHALERIKQQQIIIDSMRKQRP